MAASLFAIAKMFLSKPERYRVRVRPARQEDQIWQLGEDGAISLDKASLETVAFEKYRAEYYDEEVIEQDEIKGNFANVARCKITGTLLGPTNHHAYQGALRQVYEQRVRSEMPFERYRAHFVEVVTTPEIIEQWKESARRETIFTAKQEEGQPKFKSLGEARQHFLTHYFSKLVTGKNSATLPATVARNIPDGRIQSSLRFAFEEEYRFPNRLAQALRTEFQKTGLHIFKHRKRMLYVSCIRPRLLQEQDQAMAQQVSSILRCIEQKPGITRHDLAVKVLNPIAPGKFNPEAKRLRKAEQATAGTAIAAASTETPSSTGEVVAKAPEIEEPVETGVAAEIASTEAEVAMAETAAAEPVTDEAVTAAPEEIQEVAASETGTIEEAPAQESATASQEETAAASAEAKSPPEPATPAAPVRMKTSPVLAAIPTPESEKAKSELASNLHWLISEGFVIEFQDGRLDFPMPPRPEDEAEDKEHKEPKEKNKPATAKPKQESPEAKKDPVAAPAGEPAQADAAEAKSETVSVGGAGEEGQASAAGSANESVVMGSTDKKPVSSAEVESKYAPTEEETDLEQTAMPDEDEAEDIKDLVAIPGEDAGEFDEPSETPNFVESELGDYPREESEVEATIENMLEEEPRSPELDAMHVESPLRSAGKLPAHESED